MSVPIQEHVTLPDVLAPDTLTALLALPGGAALSARTGTEAAGRPRTVLTLTHADAEVVADTRQRLLRACRERGVRAFLV